jgi:hypothetical protein
VSRSLSRDSKPSSLVLTISNGSTATIPPTPAFSRSLPSLEPAEEKELPPPPPAKSQRRPSVKEDMGNKLSISAKDLARNDSLLSQDGKKDATETSPIVKRKALAEQGLKKFKSLAELGNGPRGRKGAPVPPTSAPREPSVDSQSSEVGPRKASVDTHSGIQDLANAQPEGPRRNMETQLPPTPDEEQDTAGPTRPKQAFVGLPSNPKTKAPASPLHMRGKSSTGFNVLKVYIHISFPSPALVR